jgi:hypothetical protein
MRYQPLSQAIWLLIGLWVSAAHGQQSDQNDQADGKIEIRREHVFRAKPKKDPTTSESSANTVQTKGDKPGASPVTTLGDTKPVPAVPVLPRSVIPSDSPRENPPLRRNPTLNSPPTESVPSHDTVHYYPNSPAERLLQLKLGPAFEQLRQESERLRANPNGDFRVPNVFVGRSPTTIGGDPQVRMGPQTQFFSPSPSSTASSGRATRQEYLQEVNKNGSLGGGVILEGVATNLPAFRTVTYDNKYNALVFDETTVYFPRILPSTLAVLCQAIAADEKERVGVSLGQTPIVFGKAPITSTLALDMAITDHFLGQIVFADHGWTSGYVFPDGFTPEPREMGGVVLFKFQGFRFKVEKPKPFDPADAKDAGDVNEVQLTADELKVRLFPPSSPSRAPDGGILVDDEAFAGPICEQCQRNADHIVKHINYYRRERVINQIFAYGEVASILRWLKQNGVNLQTLGNSIVISKG